ncbi:MAG: extracellular solute-binding protein [Lachnospiraceae bacterium]|jgi:multiple sugar transport system substrate-binding protein
MKCKRKQMVLFFLVCVVLMLTGCGQKSKDPVTVTLWHVYGGQTESPLNDLIDEFNETVGKEKNIRVQVGSVTNTNTIHENVLASAFKDPGASELPDMFVSYPKTVLAMPDDTVLVDYYDYFTDAELEEFVPAFLEEGVIHDRLSILPIAKSTEVMFINKTAFDRFSAETGADIEELGTWEGLFAMSEKYAQWTDMQTPDIPNDGKNFFVHDYHFNYFQVGVESLGGNFFKGDGVAFGPEFHMVWEPYARAAIEGGVWLQSGYATEPLRTGDSIVSVASSASILYYSNEVTYADNTSEQIEIISLPCPVFERGEKLVMQRGAGICTVKSTPEKEKACITFLKWLTEEEKNVEFVTSVGYMPVKQKAFNTCLPQAIEKLSNPVYVSLYQAFLETQKEYTFYTAPQIDSYLELETRFEEIVRQILMVEHTAWTESEGRENIEDFVWKALEDFKTVYIE